jgi:ribonuclease-3
MPLRLSPAQLKEVGRRIGRKFRQPALLAQALTHKSFANEVPAGEAQHNEGLEFLGDAVLGLVTSVQLMEACPNESEGALSKRRAALVNQQELAKAARQLGLGEALQLGKGEERSGGREKDSVLADAFEAVLAAVFLDGGLRAAALLIKRTLGERIHLVAAVPPGLDPKGHLQEILQQAGNPSPCYSLLEATGPDHLRQFSVVVHSGKREMGRGVGPSKKEAEQAAARQALQMLGNRKP